MAVTVVLVRVEKGSYNAHVGSKLLDRIGKIVSEHLPQTRCAIISDANVASLHADRVKQCLTSTGYEPTLITIPPGEKSKSLAQAGEICDRMTAAGLDRSSFVVALGGGVVGDLAGFVAAIYHRGIPYVQVPTTLLAQVDSSIGGKTAVNTAAGKNLIGALHHPVLVISDVELLRTLPPRELNQGFAEIIKHAIIRDAGLFGILQNFDPKDGFESLVRRNVEIKAEFVAADERDENGQTRFAEFRTHRWPRHRTSGRLPRSLAWRGGQPRDCCGMRHFCAEGRTVRFAADKNRLVA